ncbi:hypothetical protein CFOLD11_40820 [Clostridium folliculivorans]|uniref:Uncharacterized protein n=1 Tax=Clostridium folliculivorans TaxID=2886038 RepID=A0A9W6DC92_9CLOT|nr:hypothetical protein [Clostridium folliculivorans]GKU27255.1 hypothetical protein CFOLD11_40820 [Clostridium folliculivorans]
MSTVSISYNSLSNASNEAKHVAKRLDDYADAINKSVYKKLNNYNGPRSSNISTASNHISSKISELRSQSEQYEKYATSLTNLEKECRSTDKSVRSKVSTLTATFKQNHGISNSKIQNTVSYFFTSIGNSTAFGRWLGDGDDLSDAADDYFKQKIKDWYNYEGGEDLIKGTLVGLLDIAIGVVAVVALVASVVITGGASLALIAGAIAGIIGASNGVMNVINEFRAYSATQNDDPATGKRRSSENSIQDTLRTETDSQLLHNIATGIDVVNVVCSVVSIASSFGDLLKKGIKWTTGCAEGIKDIKLQKLLDLDIWKAFGGKLKTSFVKGWTEATTAFKRQDLSYFHGALKDFGSSFLSNAKSRFTDFSEDPFKTTKTILEAGKNLVSDGLNLGNIGKVIALPCIPIAKLPVSTDGISVDDFYSIYDDISSKVIGSSLFSNDSSINADVLNKLSSKSQINISIPNIHLPEVNFNIPKTMIA